MINYGYKGTKKSQHRQRFTRLFNNILQFFLRSIDLSQCIYSIMFLNHRYRDISRQDSLWLI